MHTVLLVTFGPLVQLLFLLLPAYLLSRWIGKHMKEGRLKRFLFYPLDRKAQAAGRARLLAKYRAGKAMMSYEIEEARALDQAERLRDETSGYLSGSHSKLLGPRT